MRQQVLIVSTMCISVNMMDVFYHWKFGSGVRLYETRNGKPNQAEMDQSKHHEGNGTPGMPVTFVQSLRNGGDDDDDSA